MYRKALCGRDRRGFTLIEVVVVVLILGILGALAAPPLGRMRDSARVQNGRHLVSAALSLARASGPQWGRVAVVEIDPVLDELRVVVDTGEVGAEALFVVRSFDLAASAGVELDSNRETLCFNSRGVGTTSPRCAAVGGWITVGAGARTDTLKLTSTGRLR